MNRWLALGLVSTFLSGSFIFASQLNSPISGQIIAASTGISVSRLGNMAIFQKTGSKSIVKLDSRKAGKR